MHISFLKSYPAQVNIKTAVGVSWVTDIHSIYTVRPYQCYKIFFWICKIILFWKKERKKIITTAIYCTEWVKLPADVDVSC